jgi:hypothetical protein
MGVFAASMGIGAVQKTNSAARLDVIAADASELGMPCLRSFSYMLDEKGACKADSTACEERTDHQSTFRSMKLPGPNQAGNSKRKTNAGGEQLGLERLRKLLELP